MIPTDWMPHRRRSDGELVGYLVLGGDSPDAGFVPLTLFGYPLAGPGEIDVAEEVLDERGLAVLAETWTLEVDGRGPTSVAIVEVTPDRVVVAENDYGAAAVVGNDMARHRLPVPAPPGLTLPPASR